MIETNTAFSETAYDCPHCGGIIMKRIDQETGQPDRVCHQCDQCGCQWSLSGETLRVGHGPDCWAAVTPVEPADQGETLLQWPTLPGNRWLYVGAAVLLFLFLARFGMLVMVVRMVVPVLLLALLVWLVWQAVKSSSRYKQ
jgi:hypothetical protein